MLSIKSFRVNPISENCYVVNDDTKEGIIIDCGCFTESEWKNIKHYIDDNKINVTHLLNTHLHFDHVMGIPWAYRDFGLNPEANNADISIYKNLSEQVEQFIGTKINTPT